MLRVISTLAIGGLILSATPYTVAASESGVGYIQTHHYSMRTPNPRRHYGYRGGLDPFVDVTGSIGRRDARSGVRSRRR
ncbi:Hypothetical protein MexAM1_META1p1909 [Methylorubrum extorquens AM1]|uniref:Uncharacterized protein n=1 Tax=Methylorubrum extorquens (strain ATCC 14718 / DSM 1338 / JCM 2805 / NCIMB 9133 / AM1) TaxID=272630 RepID=C5B1T9_METEA|nr:Hypothetical protein MexAM1_META1p1909 [Methylorubrum extorquens AM1]MCP1542137.1 hypothetical protein [Methylorubrum extorquens]MCP1590518.1 hypothetical protein [Methylorubrum extorquens]